MQVVLACWQRLPRCSNVIGCLIVRGGKKRKSWTAVLAQLQCRDPCGQAHQLDHHRGMRPASAAHGCLHGVAYAPGGGDVRVIHIAQSSGSCRVYVKPVNGQHCMDMACAVWWVARVAAPTNLKQSHGHSGKQSSSMDSMTERAPRHPAVQCSVLVPHAWGSIG